ncbi:E3 ubiquitin-protein ligase MARCH2 [Silurus asotus]|uniref:E3 ubiquitin-protein ligase MARCHF2 n=1 Tax=Silurus asotus TaxID=30991 RepID=A0AAD5ARK7_SILAS|nr:E3 ubiquitin-protein ligase MARCH2 [Silurus asotus]
MLRRFKAQKLHLQELRDSRSVFPQRPALSALFTASCTLSPYAHSHSETPTEPGLLVTGSRGWSPPLVPQSPLLVPSVAPPAPSLFPLCAPPCPWSPLSVDMTTGECCHLPGSLCDCTGNAALSKTVEDTDTRRAHDGPICRICHEGGNSEGLLSPCDCTGTLGTVHKSCLEKWLSSSNTSYCELCHTEFTIERRPRPLTEWLRDPGPRNEKRTLFCDMVCFLFITPLAAISGWLCLRGAQDHLHFNSRLEAVSFRYHCQLYTEWRRTNQKVRLLIPDAKSAHSTQHSLLSTKLLKKTSDETIV